MGRKVGGGGAVRRMGGRGGGGGRGERVEVKEEGWMQWDGR